MNNLVHGDPATAYRELGAFNTQPKNVNELRNNKFTFRIHQLPETSYKCQSANLPGISMGVAIQATPYQNIPLAGLKLDYKPLEVQFIVDEDFNNYREIDSWLTLSANVFGPTTGVLTKQTRVQNLVPNPKGRLVSDAVLTVLTNESLPNIHVYFWDAFPIQLTGLVFDNTVSSPKELVATVSFAYTAYRILDKEKGDDPLDINS